MKHLRVHALLRQAKLVLFFITLATVVTLVIWPLAPISYDPIQLTDRTWLGASYWDASFGIWIDRCENDSSDRSCVGSRRIWVLNVQLWMLVAVVCAAWASMLYMSGPKRSDAGADHRGNSGAEGTAGTVSRAPQIADASIRRWRRNRVVGKIVLASLIFATVALSAAWIGLLKSDRWFWHTTDGRIRWVGITGGSRSYSAVRRVLTLNASSRPAWIENSLLGVKVIITPEMQFGKVVYPGGFGVQLSPWVPTMIVVWLWWRMRSRHRRLSRWREWTMGRCGVCHYNLTGNTSSMCPECGTSIGTSIGT